MRSGGGKENNAVVSLHPARYSPRPAGAGSFTAFSMARWSPGLLALWLSGMGFQMIGLGIMLKGLAGPVEDRVPISQWWPWRWLFWRRVRCHTFPNGVKCRLPAVIKCVSEHFGETYARDPLCEVHGNLGVCPHSPPMVKVGDGLWSKPDMHVPIPESQKWRRVHLRLRLRFESEED